MTGHLVMLHGMTGTSEMIRPFAERICPNGWNICDIDAPFSHPKRGFAWWMRDDPPEAPLDSETLQQVELSIDHVLSSIPKDGPLIVGGFSQGAAIAQELLLTEVSDRIVGVVVIGSKAIRSLLLMERLIENKPMHMLSMHGERDHILPMQQADECAKLYEESGWEVTKIRHPKGHVIDMSHVETIVSWVLEVVYCLR